MNDHPTTTGGLALAVLREHAGVLQARAEGARAGEQARDVHQMRVATRRLRAALRVFTDVLPEAASELNEELKWVAGLLGGVRDLDVQLAHTRERTEELGVTQDAQPYVAWLEVERQRARSALLCGLDGERYRAMRSKLERAMREWQPALELAVREDAVGRIRRVAKKVWRAADDLESQSAADELHRARIKAKRLRYAVEFYVPVFGEAAEEVVKRTVDMQDLLGEHQDTVVAAERVRAALREARGGWSAQTAFALGVFVQRDTERAAEIRSEFPSVYRRLRRKAWKRLKAAF
jgi:triphosphatase